MGLGWTSFTTFHCVMMLSAVARSLGWLVVGLLAFYMAFFGVGFFIMAYALKKASDESIRLHGRKLTVAYKLGPLLRETAYELPPGSRAELVTTPDQDTVSSRSGHHQPVQAEPRVVFTDRESRTVAVARTATPQNQKRLLDDTNDYLASQGD